MLTELDLDDSVDTTPWVAFATMLWIDNEDAINGRLLLRKSALWDAAFAGAKGDHDALTA